MTCIVANTEREVTGFTGTPNIDGGSKYVGDLLLSVKLGTGADGDVTIASGTTTLVADMNYNNLTIASGAVLNTNGYKVYCRGKLTNRGTIRRNGNA